MTQNTTKVNISLPRELINKTKELAKIEGATFSGFVRVALEKRVKQNE